jgi:hypothetical protein
LSRATVSTVLGVLLVVAALRDVVHELFNPESSGSISRGVIRVVWRVVRAVGRWHRGAIYRAGPLVLISVAAVWTGMTVLGWALVYWPRLPAEFHVNATLPPSAGHGFVTALYLSLATLTTLGSNDVTPLSDGVRLAAALESLVGVVLITAWITWVLSIYPVLAERRTFEREVDLLRRARPSPEDAVREKPPEAIADLLLSLTEQVLRTGSELSQSRVSYYFQNRAPELSLAWQLPYVLALARAAEASGVAPAIQHNGALLRSAVEEMLGELGAEFLDLRRAPPDRVLAALAEDHLLRPTDRAR